MKSLVDFPSPRSAPDDVMARLREVDPATELVYIGEGLWALGTVCYDVRRAKRAHRTLEAERKLPEELRSPGRYLNAVLDRQGFRRIALFTEQEVREGLVVDDWRARDWRLRHQADETFNARLKESGNEQQQQDTMKRALDRLHTRGKDLWHHHVLHPHSVTQAGAPWRN